MRRKVLISVLLCVVSVTSGVGIFLALASLKQPPESREPAERIYNVEVFDVARQDLQELISAFGTARADREVVLSAQVAGEVIEIHPRLKVGETVQPIGASTESTDHLLLQIDKQSYQARVARAENLVTEDIRALEQLEQEVKNNAVVLQKVKADVEEYKKEYDRVVQLRKDGIASESEFTRVRLEYRRYELIAIRAQNEHDLFPVRRKQLDARKQAHEADRMLAMLDEKRTDVVAPFEGKLSEVMVERGQFVRVGDPLVRLIDIANVEIPVPLALKDYAKIKRQVDAGEHPRVVLAENETSPGRWTGRVVRVAPQADVLTRTVMVFVRVENEAQPVPLLPGTFVHARIDGPILHQAVVIPRDAIVNGKVFVVQDGRAVPRAAGVKRTLRSLAVIETGVDPGETVILTNLDVIHNGARVEIQSHRKLSDELKKQRTRVARETLAGGRTAEDDESVN